MTVSSSSSSPHPWHNVAAGCISGAGARLVVAPLDLIRIRLQLNPKQSLFTHIQQVSAESGVRGFFRGNVPATYLWMGYSGVQFAVYARLSEYMNTHPIFVISNASTTYFCAGAIAGATATLATYPLDICRTSFAARSHDPNNPRTMLGFVKRMNSQQGPRGFFAGIGPALYGIVPYMGFNFLIYETLVGEKTAVNAGVAGAVSGGVSKLIVYPLDTVKKRMQVEAFFDSQPQYRGMIDCLLKIMRNEGPLSLYSGIVPSVLKNTIATSLSFSIYTLAQNALQALNF